MRGTGRAMFAAILLLIAGTLNVIYGIGALDSANIFVNDQRYIFTNLNTLGWVLIIIGAIQFTGGLSLLAGNTYGRVIGYIGAGLGAITAVLSIGGANPWWSLAVFALCIYIIHGSVHPRRGRTHAGGLSDGGRRSARAPAAKRASRARRPHAHLLASAGVRPAGRQPLPEGSPASIARSRSPQRRSRRRSRS